MICDENRDETLDMINKSKATYCMGHLELNGFSPIPGYTMTHGDNPDIFKFKLIAVVTTICVVEETELYTWVTLPIILE